MRPVRELSPLVLLALAALAISAGLSLLQPRALGRRAPFALPTPVARFFGTPEPEPIFAIEDPSGHALDALHAALRRAERGQGTARLVFYGGSHTASDLYTGRMRELLQARFGDAGHGFVPLVPIVQAHWAWGVVIDEAEGWEVLQIGRKFLEPSRHGLAGVSFLADEPDAWAAVQSDRWGSGRLTSRITLLYDRRPRGGSFEVWLDGRLVEVLSASAERPAAATRLYRVSDGPHRIEVRTRGDGPVVVYGVLFDRDRAGVRVENLGLVGAKVRHHLLWDEDQWRAFFAPRRPDLIALAYGTNEADDTHLTLEQHEAQLRAVLRRVRDAAPDASCVMIGPTDRLRRRDDGTLYADPLIPTITELQRRLAFEAGCGFFDTLSFQGGLGAGIGWLERDPPWMRDDLVHLTRDGYLRWGETLTEALLAGY